MSSVRLPEGFVARCRGPLTLVSDERRVAAVVRAGLDVPDGWRRRLEGAAATSGRGVTSRLALEAGCVARLKQLRRGGRLAALWRDRFVGSRRALDNLRVPVEAVRRGVATPLPIALLVERAAPGLVRAWLAVEEIPAAVDLGRRFAAARPPGRTELAAVLRVVRRMHDLGVEHPDLNLGNLLLCPGDVPVGWVIDLDRARLRCAPLRFARRRRALRRLERSYVKSCHPRGASEEVRRSLYDGYAAGDGGLRRRLERGRRVAAVWIRLHRLGWRIKQPGA